MKSRILGAIALAIDASRGVQVQIAAARTELAPPAPATRREFSRCYCRECVAADKNEAWGWYQLRLL